MRTRRPRADAGRVFRFRLRCSSCAQGVNVLRAVRFRRRTYCGQPCADAVRDAHLKVDHDLADERLRICRCPGPPAPLEETGPHCVHCGHIFSTGVQKMLVERAQHVRHPLLRLRAVLNTELRLPLAH